MNVSGRGAECRAYTSPMAYHFYKLLPPRATFPGDITPEEARVMAAHAVYWQDLVRQRQVLVFGPVFDPAGVYGMAVLRAEDDGVARQLAKKDPALVAHLGFSFELHPMPDAVALDELAAS